MACGPAIRKMGAVGAVMAVKNMNSAIESESGSSQSSDLFDDGPSSASTNARKMLERVWTKTREVFNSPPVSQCCNLPKLHHFISICISIFNFEFLRCSKWVSNGE